MAGNLALFTIRSQLNEFLLFRKGLFMDMADPGRDKRTPAWGMVRPSIQTYKGEIIDFKSLAFLFAHEERASVFNALGNSQDTYLSQIQTDQFRTKNAEEVQRESAIKDREKKGNASPQDYEEAVGQYLIATMINSIQGVVIRALYDEQIYRDAFEKLRAALDKDMNCFTNRIIHADLKYLFKKNDKIFMTINETPDNYKIKNLPAMPNAIVELMKPIEAARDLST